MPRFKDQAICLRDYDWSETSQVVVLFTQSRGLVRGLAKGSRRQSPSSIQRYSGGIDLLTEGEIVGTMRDTSDLATLTEWDLQHNFFHLRQNLKAQHTAMYAAEITQLMLADHDPHPQLYDACFALLTNLQYDKQHSWLLLQYQWTLLREVGLQPMLEDDVQSREPLPHAEHYRFDPQAGGLTTSPGAKDWQVRSETVATLRETAKVFTQGNAFTSEASEHNLPNLARANRLLAAYIRYVTDRELATLTWLESSLSLRV